MDASTVSSGLRHLGAPQGVTFGGQSSPPSWVSPGFSRQSGWDLARAVASIEASRGEGAAPVAIIGWVVAYAVQSDGLGRVGEPPIHPVVVRTKTTGRTTTAPSVRSKAAPPLLYITPAVRFQPPSLEPGGS